MVREEFGKVWGGGKRGREEGRERIGNRVGERNRNDLHRANAQATIVDSNNIRHTHTDRQTDTHTIRHTHTQSQIDT